MRYDLRADFKKAEAWLTGNIRTTEDAAKLAEMLDIVMLRFDQTGCRASAVSDAVGHFYGGSHWTPTILAAIDILRKRYGRLWNYCGD
jgi:hypothetical protein